MILQWMYDNDCLWDVMLCTEAARGGQVSPKYAFLICEVDHVAQSENLRGCYDHLQIQALDWLRQHGYVCDEWTCQAAACRGNLLTLKWLHARNVPWMEGVSSMNALHCRFAWCMATSHLSLRAPWLDVECCI